MSNGTQYGQNQLFARKYYNISDLSEVYTESQPVAGKMERKAPDEIMACKVLCPLPKR
jgi:hypothetical protein